MEVFAFEIMDICLTIQKLNNRDGMSLHGEEITDTINNRYLRLHQHIWYEVFLTLNTFTMDTESGLKIYDDACVFVPPGKRHSVHEGEVVYCVYFMMERAERKKKAIYDRFCAILNSDIWVLTMNEKIRFYVSALKQCNEMEVLAGQEQLLFPLLFMEILGEVFKGEKLSYSCVKPRCYYQAVLDNYILSFLHKNITLEDVGVQLGLTSRRVSSLVKENYGCTFTQLLTRRRLQAACSLLENSDATSSEIAVAVGFENENYFYMCFKKEYDMTPQQYRQLFLKKKFG